MLKISRKSTKKTHNFILNISRKSTKNASKRYITRKKIKSFTSKIEDDMSIDLLAQFSEILRQKYKISINDDVIDSLN